MLMTEKIKDFTLKSIKAHKRIIKPWKRSFTPTSDYTEDYARGWNDCLKEMEKSHKKAIAFYESL